MDQTCFVFAKDVHQSKLSSQIREDSVHIHNLEVESVLLRQIQNRVKRKERSKSDTLFGNFQYVFLRWNFKAAMVEMSIDKLAFENKSVGEKLTHYIKLYRQGNSDPFFENEVVVKVKSSEIKSPETIASLILIDRAQKNSVELKALKSSNYLRWNFIDFFYFSTITQATVGYGDMLPNSSFIRFLVAFQTLIGIFVTVIMVTYSYDLYRRKREQERD